jgi:hypothetical protein
MLKSWPWFSSFVVVALLVLTNYGLVQRGIGTCNGGSGLFSSITEPGDERWNSYPLIRLVSRSCIRWSVLLSVDLSVCLSVFRIPVPSSQCFTPPGKGKRLARARRHRRIEEFRGGKQKVQAEEQDEEAEQDEKRLPREEAGLEVSELRRRRICHLVTAVAIAGVAGHAGAAVVAVLTYLPPMFRHKPLARLGVVRQIRQHDLAVFQTPGLGLAASYWPLELVFVALHGEVR